MKQTLGITLIILAILVLQGVTGTIDTLPEYAGWPEWSVLAAFTLASVVMALTGVSYIKERHRG
jgi:hypothetical protein